MCPCGQTAKQYWLKFRRKTVALSDGVVEVCNIGAVSNIGSEPASRLRWMKVYYLVLFRPQTLRAPDCFGQISSSLLSF